jgi:hypothetical protein
MTGTGKAAGAAHAPTVTIENTPAALEAALAQALAEAEAARPQIVLSMQEAKVAKLKGHYEAAAAELARMRAEQGGK